MIKILSGIKIVDFTLAGSGPSCSKLLAEYGASDILVEPLKGVSTRQNTQMDFYHGNKRSIAVDLKTDEGKEIMLTLVRDADVFITNYREKALVKLGLDYESLKKIKPDLIYAALYGYGEKGPMKDAPGYDITAFWAKSGLMNDMQDREGPPIYAPSGMGDTITGESLTIGVLGALYHRERTGEGMKVSTSLLAQGIYLNTPQLLSHQYGKARFPMTRKESERALKNSFHCKDGWIEMMTLNFDKDFNNILRIIGREDLIGDPRWTCLQDTYREKARELTDILDAGFAELTVEEAITAFEKYDIAGAEVAPGYKALTDEQVLANNMIFKHQAIDGKEIYMGRSPVHFGDDVYDEYRTAPKIGEHTSEILREYGYDDARIQELLDKKVVVEIKA